MSPLKNEEKAYKGFLEKNWKLIIILALITVAGYRISTMFLYLDIVVVIFAIITAKVEYSLCWSLFLIPNIRILDPLNITFIVNILIALPIIVLMMDKRTKPYRGISIFSALVMTMMELLHVVALGNYSNVVSTISVFMGLIICMLFTLAPDINIDRDSIYDSFVLGIVFSSVLYMLTISTYTTSNMFTRIFSGERFRAFADDPNYYSLYICLVIACWTELKKNSVFHVISLVLLFALGLLTTSKMCLILMIIDFVHIVLDFVRRRRNNLKKGTYFGVFAIFSLIAYFGRDLLTQFRDNFVRRLGGNNATWSTITTGRSTILQNYFSILGQNLLAPLFGYGFQYHLYLGEATRRGAHNTYMDLILAWGIVGTVIFVYLLYIWVKKMIYSRELHGKCTGYFPMLILLINFFDLSCISASMFFFVITVALLQIRKTENSTENVNM